MIIVDGSVHDFTKLNAQICIIPTIPLNSPISIHRLSPSHLNFLGTAEDKGDADEAKASPLYNSAVLTSFTPRSHLLSTHALQRSVPAFDDAIVLLRVWANQRGYGEGLKMTVRGFEGKGPWWTSLLQYLIQGEELSGIGNSRKSKRKPVGRGLSSYQLFRAALDFLCESIPKRRVINLIGNISES